MKTNPWYKGLLVMLVIGVALVFGATPASATHDPFVAVAGNGYEADQCHDLSKCGYNGPLLWNPYTVVDSGLVWTKKHWEIPMFHGTRRGSEVGQSDFADPKCFNELFSGNGRADDGVVDPIYGGPYKAPYSAWPVPEAEWMAMFSPPKSADVATPCSTLGSMCDPSVPGATTYPNVLFNNQGTNILPPNPNNYGVAANGLSLPTFPGGPAPNGVGSRGAGLHRCTRSSHKQLLNAGYNNQSGEYGDLPNRIWAGWDRNLAGSLVWDFSHPDAFKQGAGDVRVTDANAGSPFPASFKKDSETLSDSDALANVNAWYDAGYSRGLGYNLYSSGGATTANGLLARIGGDGPVTNIGFRKVNLLNPETLTWFPRPHPCNRRLWEADRFGVALGYQAIADAVAGAGSGEPLVNPPSMALNGINAPDWPPALCNQHDSGYNGNPNSADPPDPSDMRYWRWGSTGNMIPNGMVMTIAGSDRDESQVADTRIANLANRDNNLNNSTIQVPVIDVWDPVTDTQVALENARKIYPLFPMVTARETGPGWDDWDVCTIGGEAAPASQAPLPRNDNLDEAQHWRDYCSVPGCAADTRAIVEGAGGTGGAKFDCLDILGALADPNLNVPAENHWTYIDSSHNRYPFSNPMVDYTIIGDNGQTKSHKLFLIGGTHPTGAGDPFQGTGGRLIEVIELSDGNGGPAASPTWSIWGRLIQTTRASYALVLPDGNIFSSGGGGAGAPTNRVNITPGVGIECGVTIGGPCVDSVTTYARAVNIKNQILCLESASYCQLGSGQAGNLPQKGIVQVVGQMTVPRAGINAVYHLLHTGEPLQSAYVREGITRSGNRMFTPGDGDLAVNSSQIFTPPYLYDSGTPCPTSVGCKLAKRPVITKGPDYIHYGDRFKLKVDNASDVKMVSLIRTGSATQSLAQDQLYVRVPFKVVKKGHGDGDDDDHGHGHANGHGNSHNMIEVTAPMKPVQAKPGDYMLFIVNNAGTPSMAKHVRLGVDKNHKGDRGYVRVFTKRFPGERRHDHGKDHDDHGHD